MATETPIGNVLLGENVAGRENLYLSGVQRKAETLTPDQFTPGVARVVNGLRRLFTARSMEDHCEVMPLLSRDVIWDVPPILTSRKGHLRVAAYLAKFVAHLELEPSLVQVRPQGNERTLLEILGTVYLQPFRSWLVWPTLLLPKAVPIRCTIKLGVRGPLESGQIELIHGRWHNLPSFPNLIRLLNGFGMGYVPHLAEPIWSYGMEFVGDDYYKRKREREFQRRHPNSNAPILDTAKDIANDTYDATVDYGNTAFTYAADYANQVYNTVAGAAGNVYNKVADTTTNVGNTANQYVNSAASTTHSYATAQTGTTGGATTGVGGTKLYSGNPNAADRPYPRGEKVLA